MKQSFLSLWEFVRIAIVALLVVVPIRYFVFQPFLVKGASMEPNFRDGDYLVVDEISYRLRQPQRGEVIVFKYPQDLSQRYIKRIIGLPGETIKIERGGIKIRPVEGEFSPAIPFELDESDYLSPDVITAGATEVALKENEYFVLGDNRSASSDSRRWGVLPKEDIVGRALLRLWPLENIAKIEAPVY